MKRYTIKVYKPHFTIKMKLKNYFAMQNFCRFIERNVFLFLVILWMAVIFLLSSHPASLSSSESAFVYSNLSNILPLKWLFDIVPIRKCAHMFLYFVLEIFIFLHLRYKTNYPHMVSLILTYIYACSDEFHQWFVGGRGALFSDTLIDLTGAILGCILISSILYVQWRMSHKLVDDFV